MTITLATLVLCSLSPPSTVSSSTFGQVKVQIIKGKKGTVKAAYALQEVAPAPAAADSPSAAKAQELDRKSVELDARDKELSAREQALNEKQAAQAQSDQKKADQLKAQQKHLEKISEGNHLLWRQATDALAGD